MHVDGRVMMFALCINRILPVGVRDIVICYAILVRKQEIASERKEPLCGVSTFAAKRRAKRLGVCHRCMRDKPGYYFTRRCDGIRCVPNKFEKVAWVKSGKSKIQHEFETPDRTSGWMLRRHIREEIERFL
uniref:RNA silencing suppressor n=1 Tax=Glyptostrobus pensilis prunevirus TaxID=2765862 RepID=A0A8D9PH61_9VIRU|nr:TPA_exp: nucleic acid binding protein [Glyptostrobus pensilis prunevirus]